MSFHNMPYAKIFNNRGTFLLLNMNKVEIKKDDMEALKRDYI